MFYFKTDLLHLFFSNLCCTSFKNDQETLVIEITNNYIFGTVDL